MTDTKTPAERIDALEMRLTYQDEAIETLNQTITAQWKQIDALTRQLAELKSLSIETIAESTSRNFEQLFRLPRPSVTSS